MGEINFSENTIEEQFDVRTESKLLNLFDKLLNKATTYAERCERIEERNDVRIVDAQNIIMCTATSKTGKRFIDRWFNEEYIPKEIKLDYISNNGLEIKSMYDIEYLSIIVEILKKSNMGEKNITVRMKGNFPMMINNKHFEFVLAPLNED